MNDTNKIFCGKGKTIGQYGAIAINVCLSDIPEEHIYTSKSGKKYVNIVVRALRTPKEDRTHYLEINTYKETGNIFDKN